MGKFEWNDDRDERLRQLWPTSLPTSAIAKDIGCKLGTLSGRAKLLGLPSNRKPGSVPLRASGAGVRANTEASGESDASIVHEREFLSGGDDGESKRTCQWPIGDPKDPDFRFCPNKAAGRFCEEHTRKAHATEESQPMLKGSRQLRIFGGCS